MMKKPELLVPAKDFECMKKVIEHGADSVYMGLQKFNARMFGKNFTILEFKDGIDYAHKHGVKVYLTLNTLIKENELENAVSLANQAVKAGVDGILIQDLGLAFEIRRQIPYVAIHASTQMSVANHYGVKILSILGFSRVVLAREINSEEVVKIKHIVNQQFEKNIEIEIFIHGGLCIAYSGQCFASSYCYMSSANRGKCKMPCWENYDLFENKNYLGSGNIIRPRDLSGINELQMLIKGGIDCLKIQGRLRNKVYISEVVEVYRKCIDAYIDKLLTEEKFIDYENKLTNISSRGLTSGNLSPQMAENMIVNDISTCETIGEVSEIRYNYRNFLAKKELKTTGVQFDKKISINLHKLNKEYLYSELSQEISRVYIPFREFIRGDMEDVIMNICRHIDTFLYLPSMVYERNCDQYYVMIDEIVNKYCLKGIVLSNLSDLILVDLYKYKNIELISGNHIHVMNSLATESLSAMGVTSATLSLELSPRDALMVVKNSVISLEQIVYGHPELMHLKYCPYKKRNECGDCNSCSQEEYNKRLILKGENNIFEILLLPEQTESILYSTKILSVPPDNWIGDSVRMDFLWETPKEINEIVTLMRRGQYYLGSEYVQSVNVD